MGTEWGDGTRCGRAGLPEPVAGQPFLPSPVVRRHRDGFTLDRDRPQSVGRVRSFAGNFQVVVRAYAWLLSLGAEGLRTVAQTAVLNNNYLAHLLAPDLVVLVAAAELGVINAVRSSVDALGPLPVAVYLNRYDAANELHRRNREWLTDRDELDVCTTLDEVERKLLQK